MVIKVVLTKFSYQSHHADHRDDAGEDAGTLGLESSVFPCGRENS